MRVRFGGWGFAALGALGLVWALAGVAGATTTVSNVGGVEMIVSVPDRPVAAAPRRGAKARAAAEALGARAAQAPGAAGRAEELVRMAMGWIGVPYVWGGSSPSGFDCSGFTWYAYRRVGISIPRTADVQFAAGRPVAGDPLPGDLVFFQTYDYGASHVGLYVGNGWFVNAIGSDVHLANFNSSYFRGRYLGARRFLD